jgi:hypothetical protein
VSDFDGLEETGFGALSVCLRAPERDLTIDGYKSASQNRSPDRSTNAKAS